MSSARSERKVLWCGFVIGVCLTAASPRAGQTSPGAGPVIVLETAKGAIEFETYPEEAPKTVAAVLALVRKGFYDGQRFHRAEPDFLVQAGDPASRDMGRREWWGRGGSGVPIGVAEITRKRRNLRSAVAITYIGTDPRKADSQFYILLKDRPDLDSKYAVFGRVIGGLDVADRIQAGDEIRKASVREGPGVP